MDNATYDLIVASVNRSRMAKGLVRNAKDREAALSAIRLTALDLGASIQSSNPRFDSATIVTACGFSPLYRGN